MRNALVVAALLLAVSATAATSTALKPTTTDNDDSCDIALLPAATLLLPYFEVDFTSPPTIARTTLVTIQNTTAAPQIARVTLWTDWSYPMFTFNLFLTGYDVQSLNFYDIFTHGVVASSAAPPGALSLPQNPHFLPDAAATCSTLPGPLAAGLLAELKAAFTTGKIAAPSCAIVKNVGGVHANAVGYATIDVVANCDSSSPIGPNYFGEILFDNVLTGDYQHVDPNPAIGNYAGGNPLVHIRAVPEGGTAGQPMATNLPFTFYDLYTVGMLSRTHDRRQPLPSAFLPRFIAGGTNAFNTNLQIWREAIAAPTVCPIAYTDNSSVPIAETVRFDEHENPTYEGPTTITILPPSPPGIPSLVTLSSANTSLLPPFSTSGDVGGWFFLNLNNGGSRAYSAARNFRFGTTVRGPRQNQAWVVTSMSAEGRYAVEMDAAAVGNGCSPAPELSAQQMIGPAPNPTPAATSTTRKPATTDNDDSCDIGLYPAATLLLPYFEVDFRTPQTIARTTLVTIQNTTAMPQIARVTLWTDWSYPMLTFNLFLTGYDVQGINLYSLFTRGLIAPGFAGTSNTTPPGAISLANDQNPHFLPDAATTCSSNPGQLSPALLLDLQSAFTTGNVAAPGCAVVNAAGGTHANAIGYATIDVVANCNATSPLAPEYFNKEILFDNVLTGDYQHINPDPATGNYAGGNPLVHIRAIPEGGAAGVFAVTALPFTFYDLYTSAALWRTQDRRQPLPSAFLPRFIQGGLGGFNTNLQIWREAFAAPTICPTAYKSNSDSLLTEVIAFDEHENPTYLECGVICPPFFSGPPSASSSRVGSAPLLHPYSPSGDLGGWFFLNLNNRPARAKTVRPSQAWVVTSMSAEGRYAVEMDAIAVGNGCSPAIPADAQIGPPP